MYCVVIFPFSGKVVLLFGGGDGMGWEEWNVESGERRAESGESDEDDGCRMHPFFFSSLRLVQLSGR